MSTRPAVPPTSRLSQKIFTTYTLITFLFYRSLTPKRFLIQQVSNLQVKYNTPERCETAKNLFYSKSRIVSNYHISQLGSNYCVNTNKIENTTATLIGAKAIVRQCPTGWPGRHPRRNSRCSPIWNIIGVMGFTRCQVPAHGLLPGIRSQQVIR